MGAAIEAKNWDEQHKKKKPKDVIKKHIRYDVKMSIKDKQFFLKKEMILNYNIVNIYNFLIVENEYKQSRSEQITVWIC